MTIIDTRTPDPKRLIPGATGDWEVIIGMEVHAQVTSEAKLFSGASTAFGAAPNANVSLVDAAMPGMLPVINEECVRQAIRTGLGLKAQINHKSVFDRKNYFYPDLPQGYQISQFKQPIVGEGTVTVSVGPDREGQFRGHRGRHRAAASGAGRRQVDARPASDHVLCRSQPLRRGADGDRVEAGHALVRRGQGLSDQAAHHRALSRHLRRQHGRRLDARRRQRLGAQAGRPIRHALRDQERQLDPLRRPGHRIRGAPPDRACSRTAARSTRRRGCSIRTRARRARCAPRKRRTTIAISPIRTCCRWSSTRPMSTRWPSDLPELPDDKKERLVAEPRPVGLRRLDARLGKGDRRLFREGGGGPRRQDGRQLGHQRSARRLEQGRQRH